MSAETSSKPNVFPVVEKPAGPGLDAILREEIRARGAISFARFMELALYHPAFGYYRSHRKQTGRSGDFYTSVSVGALYGELLAHEFARRLDSLPGEVCLVEAAAHDGNLALDILSYLRQYREETFNRLRYWIIEPAETLRREQQSRLEPFGEKVRWCEDWAEAGSFRGICFSNELLDAMPVHRFQWSASQLAWMECGVGADARGFSWQALPVADDHPARPLLPVIPPELAEVLPDGFSGEVSPAAVEWWESAARALKEGWLITADYGFEQEEFLQPERGQGTIRAYSRHRSHHDVLADPGSQDITAHVNFTHVREAGERQGLATEQLTRQGLFLESIMRRVTRDPAAFPLWTPLRYRQLTSLMHPEHLGRSFRFLVQRRS